MREQAMVAGFRGVLSDVEVLPEGDPTLPVGPNLVAMAERALDYLCRNPDPQHGYDARFTFFPHLCPPFAPEVTAGLLPGGWKAQYQAYPHVDPVAIGDTESRNDLAFNLMREMTGSEQGQEVQEIVHARLVGYVRSGPGDVGDDLCWAVPFSLFSEVDGAYAMPWTTAMLLHSAADRYRLTGKERERRLARRLFEGLRRMAHWDAGRAFYPGGGSPFQGDKLGTGYEGHYPIVLSPLIHYALACGDPEALAFAEAMAEGFLADVQPGHLHKADGHLHGHCHCQMHAVRGMAHLGAHTGNARYLDWAEQIYAFFRRGSLDTGWLPELLWHPEHRFHAETCLVADLLETEAWMARAGRPNLWDRVERTVRNYLVPVQFSMTPAFEAFWRQVNADKSPAKLAQGMAGLRELEGAFLGGPSPNDWVAEVPPGQAHHGSICFQGRRIMMDLPGCCPPSAMRALHVAWAKTLVRTPYGVMVNLPFDRDAPEATVASDMPRRGRLRVTPKATSDFWLRPPAWAPREGIEATRGGKRVEVRWGGPTGGYVAFPDARVGEALELAWPLVRFRQRITLAYMEDSDLERAGFVDGPSYTFHWTGSTVTGVEPVGEWLPMYDG